MLCARLSVHVYVCLVNLSAYGVLLHSHQSHEPNSPGLNKERSWKRVWDGRDAKGRAPRHDDEDVCGSGYVSKTCFHFLSCVFNDSVDIECVTQLKL